VDKRKHAMMDKLQQMTMGGLTSQLHAQEQVHRTVFVREIAAH
jgi:hypothetical protein